MVQRVSPKGRAEIAAHEGIVLSPYRDSVGVWTFGIGHTASAGDPDPARMPKGKEQSVVYAMQVFERDLAKFEARVRQAFTRPLSQHQFDAAVSFDFNTGGIHKATWVRRFNAGDDEGARRAFMNWRKPPEIIPRRRKERDLFFSGRYSSNGYATVYPATASGAVLWGQGKRMNVIGNQPAPKPAPTPSPRPEPPTAERGGIWHAILRFLKAIIKGGRP